MGERDFVGTKNTGRRGQGEKPGLNKEQLNKKQSIIVYAVYDAPNYLP